MRSPLVGEPGTEQLTATGSQVRTSPVVGIRAEPGRRCARARSRVMRLGLDDTTRYYYYYYYLSEGEWLIEFFFGWL